MKRILLLCTFIFTITLTSQQTKIDSLKNILKLENKDSKKLKILENLNEILFDQASLDEALPYFNQMTNLAIKLNQKKTECESYRYIAEYYMRQQDFENAKKITEKSLKINKKLNEVEQQILDLNLLARVYHHFQKYEEAIKIYNEGITLYKKNPKGNVICNLYSNVGIAYGLINQNENSINAYIKGLDYAEKLNDIQSKFMFLNNLGWTYIAIEQYVKAEKYLLKGLNDSLNITSEFTKMSLHHTIGLNYSRWGKYNEALKHNKIVLKYLHDTGNKLFEFDVLNSIGVIYLKTNQLPISLNYFEKAYQLALEINNKTAIQVSNTNLGILFLNLKEYAKAEKIFLEMAKDTINEDLFKQNEFRDLYDNLSAVYEGKKNYKMAFKYHKQFKTISDSIMMEARDSKVNEIATKYQTEKKETENLKLKTEKVEQAIILEKEISKKRMFSFGLAASIFILVIGGYFYQKNKKQKVVIVGLQKELHHRIKNNLAIINTFIEVAKEEFSDIAFNNKLTELQNRIASINEVHQQLYKNADITSLSVKKYVQKLVHNIQQSFANDNIVVSQNINDYLKLNAEQSFSVGLIINEFLTNSFKYAFDNNAGTILIEMKDDHQNLLLALSDNGKGLPKDFDIQQTETFGIRVMKLLTQQLKGSFNLETKNGVTLNIHFPK
ncbi:MAG: tetratricopeptide repeat protein [Lutibacter sp.]|nr:tetratricopeptide repeat protein [Lutibacter sp.]